MGEKLVDDLALVLVQVAATQDADLLLGQGRHDVLIPAAVLLLDQRPHAARNPLQLRRRVEPIRRHVLRRHAAKRLLPQPGDADHEEFVQVVAEDRQKLHPLQQRIRRVLRFFQHARIKLQPTQLAGDEVLAGKHDGATIGARPGAKRQLNYSVPKRGAILPIFPDITLAAE